ncbi:MAG: hypothetical protein QME87_10045 [Bacillota bacterium]|nr:hypothetical protein [Bacillota bacterium]
MDLVEAFAREVVSEGAYTFKRAVEEGISPGFLGVVLSENLELVVPVLLARAREVGEAYCPKCREYRDLAGATRIGDMARCPRCGTGLRADHCALCGEDLHYPETGVWNGVRVAGFSVCPGCEGKARRVLAGGGAR